MAGSERDRRLIGSSAADGLLSCCESWLAEQVLGELKQGRDDRPRPDAVTTPTSDRGRAGSGDKGPDIRLV